MTKKACILVSALLLLTLSAFAQPAHQPPLSEAALAAILGQPAGAGSCAQPQSQVQLAAKRPTGRADCTASASCDTGPISCTGSAGCTAADRDCSLGEQGHVTCDGVTTTCSNACPAPCSTGTLQQRECCQCDLTSDCEACYYCAHHAFTPDC